MSLLDLRGGDFRCDDILVDEVNFGERDTPRRRRLVDRVRDLDEDEDDEDEDEDDEYLFLVRDDDFFLLSLDLAAVDDLFLLDRRLCLRRRRGLELGDRDRDDDRRRR